jgi:hypothetical protein
MIIKQYNVELLYVMVYTWQSIWLVVLFWHLES